MPPSHEFTDHPVASHIESGESIRTRVRAMDGDMIVTDRRLAVAAGGQLKLNIPLEGLRRVQFDLEHGRLPTMVLVPHQASEYPQVLSIPPEELEPAAEAVRLIGTFLATQPGGLPPEFA